MSKKPTTPVEPSVVENKGGASEKETKNKPEGLSGFDKLKNLTEIPPHIKKVLTELEDGGVSFKDALKEVNSIIEELEKNPEYAASLESFKASIEKLYQEESNEKLDTDIVDRATRDLGLAEQLEMMEGGREFDRSQIAGILERQNWGKIFTGLQAGDRVLSFFVPGADFLSIKNLNDKVFGPQVTNKIIVQKRIIIEDEIKKLDKQASILQSDYKIEVVKVSKESKISLSQLEEMSAAVDAAMTKFICEEIVDKLIAEERKKLEPFIIERSEGSVDKNSQEKIKMLEANIDKWDEFKVALQGKTKANFGKSGFRMNYGLASVQGDQAEDKLLAINQSLQTSRMVREKNDSYGAEHNEGVVMAELEKIKDLREEIMGAGNKITDIDGNEFIIFLPVPVESAATRYTLNRDLLRDVRKGKFQSEDESVLKKVILYTKKLNILDAVKPFIFKEINTVAAEAEENKKLSEKIWDKKTKKGEDLNKKEIKDVVDALSSEEKDRAYTSKNEFNKRAIALKECAYVSLDVLDLGVDLLLEYESILQDIDQKTGQEKIDEFNKRSLSAGDETTKKLRDFRAGVAEICRSEKFRFAEGLITAEVGGDELTLAVDTSNVSEEKLEEFLFALKDKTNTRVIKTVVAKSEKDASSEQDLWKLSELHLQALKRAEHGVTIAKDIEEAERKLSRLLKQQGEDVVREKIASLRGLFILDNGQVRSNVVITEKEGVFKVGQFKLSSENKDEEVYDRVGYEFDYETIRSDLDSVLNKNSK